MGTEEGEFQGNWVWSSLLICHEAAGNFVGDTTKAGSESVGMKQNQTQQTK